MVVFHVRVSGSWPGFIALNIALALFAAAFGLLIAALGRTPEATRGIAIFSVLVLVMLGGAWVPSFLFPEWVQKTTLIIPTRWAMDGFDAMTWRGLGWHFALAPVAMLLGCALACTLLTLRFFQWEAD
jgi:ABC-2 type transport system permease protein